MLNNQDNQEIPSKKIEESASYTKAILRELLLLALRNDKPFLAYLLAMAIEEAARV